MTVQGLGALAARAGDDRTSIRLGAAANALARRIGVEPPLIPIVREPLDAARGRLSPDEIAIEEDAASTIEARPFLEAAIAAHRAVVVTPR